MPLQVLSDNDVSKILHSFNKEDILQLQETLADALHWYSTSSDANDCCSEYQPERTALKRKDGSTTLYLPASGITGQGVKVVNIIPPEAAGLPDLASSISDGDSRSSFSSNHRGSFQSGRSSTSSIPSSVSQVAESASNLTVRSKPDSAPTAPSTIKGSLTLLDNAGNTIGLINAEEVTAFRTA